MAILEQGLIIGLMALGVYISFRIVDLPDLTTDGSFALGAAVAVRALVSGFPAWLAIMLAAATGALAGSITGTIHRKLKINVLLAGILVMTMLYSVNLRVMGGPNLPVPRVVPERSTQSFEEMTLAESSRSILKNAQQRLLLLQRTSSTTISTDPTYCS